MNNGSELYAVAMTADNDFNLFKSTDNGLSWNEDPVFHSLLNPLHQNILPSIALENGVHPHVVYVSREEQEGSWNIRVWHQWFDGLFWAKELVELRAHSNCLMQGQVTDDITPSITVEPNGTVHIAWQDSDNCPSPYSELFYWNSERPDDVETIITSVIASRFQFPSIAIERSSGSPIPMVIYQDNHTPQYLGEDPGVDTLILQKFRDPVDELWKGCLLSTCAYTPGEPCSLVSRYTGGGIHPFLDEEVGKLQAIWESPRNNGIYHDFFLECGSPTPCLQWERYCRIPEEPLTVYDQGDDNVNPAVDGTIACWAKITGTEWEIWYAQFDGNDWNPIQLFLNPGRKSVHPHVWATSTQADFIWTNKTWTVIFPWRVLYDSQ